jgi:hypothetical protein
MARKIVSVLLLFLLPIGSNHRSVKLTNRQTNFCVRQHCRSFSIDSQHKKTSSRKREKQSRVKNSPPVDMLLHSFLSKQEQIDRRWKKSIFSFFFLFSFARKDRVFSFFFFFCSIKKKKFTNQCRNIRLTNDSFRS